MAKLTEYHFKVAQEFIGYIFCELKVNLIERYKRRTSLEFEKWLRFTGQTVWEYEVDFYDEK